MNTHSRFQLFAHPILVILLLFLLAVVVRSIPLQFDGSFDPDSHFHARLSNDIARTHEIPTWDSLSLQGRVYSYPPVLHVLTGILSLVTGQDSLIVLKFLGILIGALMVISVFLLAFSLSRSVSLASWAGFFASLSIMGIWRTSGFTRPDGLALMLIPFLLYLWITQRSKLATVLSIGMVLLHPLSAVVYAATLGVYFLVSLVERKRVSFWIPIALVGMLITFFLWVFSIGLPLSNYASHVSLEASELTKFWLLGLILFFPLSWAFNFVGAWKAKLPTVLIVWVALTLGIGSLGMRLAIYMIPFLGILGAYGITHLIQTFRAQKIFLPALSVFVIILGLATVYLSMNGVNPYYSPAERVTIDHLGQNAIPGSSVLAIWDQGHVLAYYTGLPQVVDGYFEFAHELDERVRVSKQFLQSTSCEDFVDSMDEFNARYYYISHGELHAEYTKYGFLGLESCPPMRILFSSDDARIYERVPGVSFSKSN